MEQTTLLQDLFNTMTFNMKMVFGNNGKDRHTDEARYKLFVAKASRWLAKQDVMEYKQFPIILEESRRLFGIYPCKQETVEELQHVTFIDDFQKRFLNDID